MNAIKTFTYRLLFSVGTGVAFLLMLPITLGLFLFVSAAIGAMVLKYRLRNVNWEAPVDRTSSRRQEKPPIEGLFTRV